MDGVTAGTGSGLPARVATLVEGRRIRRVKGSTAGVGEAGDAWFVHVLIGEDRTSDNVFPEEELTAAVAAAVTAAGEPTGAAFAATGKLPPVRGNTPPARGFAQEGRES